jgi:RND superfamily putative drug exporter
MLYKDAMDPQSAPVHTGIFARIIRAILHMPLLTIGIWVVLGGAGMLFLPTVGHVAAEQNNATLPSDSPTIEALKVMDKSFGTGRAKSFLFVVFDNKDGLSTTDEAAYGNLVARLKARPAYVAEVQDYLGDEDKKKALTSDDGQGTYLPVGLTSNIGSPESAAQVAWVRAQVKDVEKAADSSANIYVTGDPANVVDITKLGTDAGAKMGIISGVLLMLVLLVIYRRVSSIVVPLVTIGVAVMCSLAALSVAGSLGMGLSTITESYTMAIILGAGTDYSIFLISRFREEYAKSGDVRSAVAIALRRIGGALIASAGTVAVSSMVLHFAKLSIFSTTGPAIALAVTVTVAVALTVTPVLLLIFGKKIGPATLPTATSFWTRVGNYVAAKPARILIGGTAALLLMAAAVPSVTLAYSERPSDPNATESNQGLASLDKHFGKYATAPDYVLVVSKHDMRNSRDLAVLAAASRDIAKVSGVSSVRSAAQPGGDEIDQTRITSQLSTLGDKLSSQGDKIANGKAGLNDLKNGTSELASGASRQAAGMRQAASAMPRLISGLEQLKGGTNRSASGARQLSDAARQLRQGTRDLANGLEDARSGAQQSTSGLGQVYNALQQDPACGASPICGQARAALGQIYAGQRDKLVPGLARTANAANQLASGNGRVSDGLHDLAAGLKRLAGGQGSLADGQRSLYGGLNQLADGSSQLAAGLDSLPPGISKIVDNTIRLSDGLDETGEYLSEVGAASNTAEAGGFYLPPSELDSEKFGNAVKQFLSPDGKVARIQILGSTNPGGSEGIDRFNAAKAQVVDALDGTTLDDSDVLVTGAGGGSADLRDYFHDDFKLVLIAVLLTVLLLMMVTLRAIVAPLYLLVSVILSYGAALGTAVVLFQHILGQDMPFNVPVIAFVILVAVGADYNILLMSRMREDPGKLKPGVVGRAVTATGPVITTAGIIFACSFLPMTTSSLAPLAQLCFTIVVGLLLDTFIVRTLIVPACAVIVGDASWWPGQNSHEADSDAETSAVRSKHVIPAPRMPVVTGA